MLMLLCFWSASLLSQEIDWKTYDPKKATPEENDRVNRFLENNFRNPRGLGKTAGKMTEIRSFIMKGNKITTIVYNYGNITRPNTLGNVADLVWNKLGYGFEFTPLAAGQVVNPIKDSLGTIVRYDTLRILDDGMWLASQGGYSLDNTVKWGWLPKDGYAAPGQVDIAAWSQRGEVGASLTKRPHAWPESWYNAILGRYVWPAFLGNDATTPDEEVYFVVDDYTNQKYSYYPFPTDSTKRGLGLDMECRFFQFNNPLAEDLIFLVYQVTNKSPKDIDRMFFGMYGDPHVGGPSNYSDDRAYFIPPRGTQADPYPQRARSMVYAWDDDMKGDGGLKAGYFGFKFLESPTNSSDGIDNDDDGIIDESPYNTAGFYIDGASFPLSTGIADTAKYVKVYGKLKPRWSGDEDGDWDPAKDDVGIDGIPGTGDFGEGNGKPDVGYDQNGNFTSEPNFGIRDVHESDQIGLTSFNALAYTNTVPNVPKNDVFFWDMLASNFIDTTQTLLNSPGDNVILYGSGPFSLKSKEVQRFSIAILFGNDLPDLLLNAETAQMILENNYRFAQPPPKPNVTAVPGDHRVTLYWDKVAELGTDPLTGLNDFEGYKIYRSEDPSFTDVFTITDANGSAFLGKPFIQNGTLAQFDLVNEYSGLSLTEYAGRGVRYNLGYNNGLVHSYVDSSAINGKTYYYAVVSYDHGADSLKLAPAESQAVISQDPITQKMTFDVNTVMVVPNPVPSGNMSAKSSSVTSLTSTTRGTGNIRMQLLDENLVQDNEAYVIDFVRQSNKTVFNIRPTIPVSETFISDDTVYVSLAHKELIKDSVWLYDRSGTLISTTDYIIDLTSGRLRGKLTGALVKGASYTIKYLYNAVFESNRINNEDDNPVFDGIRPFVANDPLALDVTNSRWYNKNNTNLVDSVYISTTFGASVLAPFNLRIAWNSTEYDTTKNKGYWLNPGDTLYNTLLKKVMVTPFKITNLTDTTKITVIVKGATLRDSCWKPAFEIIFLAPQPYAGTNPKSVMYHMMFKAPSNGTTSTLIYPTQGNYYEVHTKKPFVPGDKFGFTTQAVKYDPTLAQTKLDNIYVVPNPYVAYSGLEQPGTTASKRGDLRIQFRNLPPKCTIRIFTLVGELVDTIQKDDMNSYANWAVLSSEGHRLAYGVYIYHVEAPGVGNKIGRLALIK